MCSESSPWQRTRARCREPSAQPELAAPALRACGNAGPRPGATSGARDRAGLTKGSDKFRAAPDCQPGTWGAGLRRVVFRLGYSSKSAGRLAKIRKRSQLGEILPIRHPAPFSRLPSFDPRSTAARTGSFGRPITKSPTRRDVLDTEPLRVHGPQRVGVPNLTVGEDLPPLLGSVPIVEPRTRAELSLVLEDEA